MKSINQPISTPPSPPVSERCDDQPLRAAQKLILVDSLCVSDADDALVCFLNEVETGLLQPLKVCWGSDVFAALRKKV